MTGKYDVKFDPNYTWDPLSIIAKRIKENSIVLEFGPANGRLTRYLKEQKKCIVDIVEYDIQSGAEAAHFARNSCLGVEQGDIELNYWVDSFKGNQYDYIIFADVLEHLRNPKEALRKCKKFLKNSGEIVMSVPNIAHNAIVLSLLDGHFPYMDTGLLDRTHVFFFTKETILAMLNELGYFIYFFDRITRKPEDSEFKNTYNSFSQELQAVLKFREEGESYQYVLSCGVDRNKKNRILSREPYSDFIYQNILKDRNDSVIDIYPEVISYFKDGGKKVNKLRPKIKDNKVFLEIGTNKCEKIHINFFTGIPISITIEQISAIKSNELLDIDMDFIQGNFYEKVGKTLYFYTLKPYIVVQKDNFNDKLTLQYIIKRLDNIKITHYFDCKYDEFFNQLNINQKNIAKIEYLTKQVERKNNELQKINVSLCGLKNELNVCKNQLLKCTKEKYEIEQSFLNSRSWKLTSPLRRIKHMALSTKSISAFWILRSLYLSIPINARTKDKLKNTFYSKLGFLVRNQIRYRVWLSQQKKSEVKYDLDLSKQYFTKELTKQPGKIAIHIHLYYTDLLEEFCKYLSNMPYHFDVLISITSNDGDKKGKIKKAILAVPMVNQCIIRILPNRGRDVAPFFVGFGDLIGKYEFIAHIHTKKSLYTGCEQVEWRDYLLDQLLGNKANIMKIFWEFKNHSRLGLIYPRPSMNIPYVAFTWLSNKNIGLSLLRKLGIGFPRTTYFDYSAGTMFWARTTAIKKLYSGVLQLDDFPLEKGQTDGTVAHAIERIMCMVVNSENMDYYETDFSTNSYTVNYGSKNLWQYYSKCILDKDSVFSSPMIISFDVFDTLIMRNIAQPDFVNDILEIILKDSYGININFKKMRLLAEQSLRAKIKENEDITLSQIYDEFSKITGLSMEVCNKIKNLEVQKESELCVPRKDMVDWFNYAKKMNKDVILVSDMYLEKKDVEILLQKCGISGYKKLFVSSQTFLRKDTKQIWKYFYEHHLNDKMIHIGDNERSDWQIPTDMKFNAYHVMSAINLFQNCKFGYSFFQNYSLNVFSAALLGPVLSKRFNSPFAFHDMKYLINDFEELGYTFYGPVLAYYILWLIKERRNNNYQSILFFARDGYFLKPLYEKMCQWLGIKAVNTIYFLASRRATSVASFTTIEQVEELLDIPYNGSIKNFFQARLGISLDGDDYLQQVNLPRDKSTLKKVIQQMSSTILEHAKVERKNYVKYINRLNLNFDENIAVVDMGYAGTIQHYLTSLTNKDYTGYYFATNQKNWFHDDHIKGCFANDEDYATTASAVFKYQLIFECVLTSPNGQLLYFNEEGEPVYGEIGSNQNHIQALRKIHEGVEKYCKDLISTYGNTLFDLPVDLKFFDIWTKTFVKNQNEYEEGIKQIYYIDDSYCNGLQKNVFDFYKDF